MLSEKIYAKVLESLVEGGRGVVENSSHNDIEDYYEVTPEDLEKLGAHLNNLAKKQREIQSKLVSARIPDEKLRAEMKTHFDAIHKTGIHNLLRHNFAPDKK